VVDQLRTAIRDNERWFDELHLNYEEALQRVADLEHDIVGADRDRAVVENELRRCQHEMDDMVYERDQAQTAIHELQTSLAEVEAQLAATVDDYTTLLGNHGAELAALKLVLFERDSQALLQTEQIRLESERVAKLEGELKTSHLILASQEGEVATLKDKIGTMRFEANEKMFEARAEIDGLKRDIEAKDAEVEEMVEEMGVMKEEQERGDRERGEVSQRLAFRSVADDAATTSDTTLTAGRGQCRQSAGYRPRIGEPIVYDELSDPGARRGIGRSISFARLAIVILDLSGRRNCPPPRSACIHRGSPL
jgi:chromosome segregation ATPase